jgi:signal transduction histidine kinase
MGKAGQTCLNRWLVCSRSRIQNSQRLVRLVNDILDIEKLESANVVFNFERSNSVAGCAGDRSQSGIAKPMGASSA